MDELGRTLSALVPVPDRLSKLDERVGGLDAEVQGFKEKFVGLSAEVQKLKAAPRPSVAAERPGLHCPAATLDPAPTPTASSFQVRQVSGSQRGVQEDRGVGHR